MALEQKLVEAARRKEVSQIDWAKKRDEWKLDVGKLYDTIAIWLTDLTKQGLIRLERDLSTVTEDYIGSYSVDSLQIAFGDKVAILDPVGTNVIGAHGRIDFYIQGDKTKAFMLVLVDFENSIKTWRICNVWERQKTEPFTKDVLEAILDQWLET